MVNIAKTDIPDNPENDRLSIHISFPISQDLIFLKHEMKGFL